MSPAPSGRRPRPLAALVAAWAVALLLIALGPLARAEPARMSAAPADPSTTGAPASASDLAAHARAAQPAIPLPVTVRAGRIIVRAEAGLDGMAARVAARADDELRAIETDLAGLPTPPVAEIRLVHDAADLGRAAPPGRGAPGWAAGVAYPDVGVVVVATYRGPSSIDVQGTVDHELAHLALGAALGPAAPRWLHEGFAWLHSSDWSLDRTQTLTGMAWFGGTIPLTELEIGFPLEEAPASRAYAESYDFVAFLARRGRWPDAKDDGDRYPFQVFLAQTAATGDVDVAAQRAFGRPLQQLFDEWDADLKSRYMFVPIGLFLGGLWVFASLLLFLGWRRRRRQYRKSLAEWERREAAAAARRAGELGIPIGLLAPIDGADPAAGVFRLVAPSTAEARAAAAVAAHESLPTVAVLAPRDDVGRDLTDAFVAAATAAGITVSRTGTYDPTASDLEPDIKAFLGLDPATNPRLAAHLRRHGKKGWQTFSPDVDFAALYIPDTYDHAALVVAFLPYLGVELHTEDFPDPDALARKHGGRIPQVVQLIGGSGWNHPGLLTRGGDLVEGAMIVDVCSPVTAAARGDDLPLAPGGDGAAITASAPAS
ncbi:MAG: hypothetical protein H6708_29970 [Kofleriaceae bacterium]|nr:hypothetical protein [Kofleriaceae bacterium]